jgi:hypothetical protein
VSLSFTSVLVVAAIAFLAPLFLGSRARGRADLNSDSSCSPSEANAAALVAAGLVSVLIFPSAALSVLRGRMATVRMAPAPGVQ